MSLPMGIGWHTSRTTAASSRSQCGPSRKLTMGTGESHRAGAPDGQQLTLSGARPYDVSPDGQRFLMIKDSDQKAAPPNIVVVLNWAEELKRLLPDK